MIADLPSDDFIDRIRARLGDRYEISRELLGGGMSRVFVAREIALDRQIVIKFLPPEIAAGANRDRFRREIQMAARLSHPHIAPLFSAAEEGELLYYTMPFVSGESLRHSLEAGRVFGISETVEILRDVADALAYAHRAGIVHRDIKPANILREGDHAVVTDFGVAKAVSFALGLDTRASAATVSGMAIGTPAYMAPEQIAGDVTADHRVDIYAFGLLGYELLTGHSPFRAPSPQAQLAAQLTQSPPPIADARADVPPALAALLTRCLEKDADRRPPSAESVIEVLRAVSTTSGQIYASPPAPGSSRTRQAALGAGALAVAAAIWFAAAKTSQSPAQPVKPVVDSAKVAAVPTPPTPAPVAELTKAERDSLRVLGEINAKREARLLALLKDSISNALHKTLSDSVAKANAAELAAARLQDSIAKAHLAVAMPPGRPMPPTDAMMRGNFMPREAEAALNRVRDSLTRNGNRVFVQGPSRASQLAPEAFAARALNMGPARRVGVSVFSGLRSAPLLSAATVVRDSLIARLRGKSRYIIIPTDSVVAALAKSHSTDSLRTSLNADMWMTINVSGEVGADSLTWNLSLRDFSANSAFSNRGMNSRKVSTSNFADPATVSQLMTNVMQVFETMDKAPRRDPALR